MSSLRALVFFVLAVLPGLSATFGTVVQHAQPISDLVVDDARKRLYLVNPATSQVEVYNTATNPPKLAATIATDSTPLAAAISRNGRSLYVACYGASAIDVIDLTTAAFSTRSVTLAARPEAVAVGYDERVLISTTGTTSGQAVLVVYDPNAATTGSLIALPIAPTAPSVPAMPPPNGVMALASHAHLRATPDGRTIVGVHELANNTRTVFVYEVQSATVLRARNVPAITPVLAVSPDGTKMVSGPLLFDTSNLLVLAQQSAVNSPYSFPANPNFNTQTTQGGAVFAPDNSVLFTGYDIAPVGAARNNIAQLLVNSPAGMQIQLGIQLPENLNDRMVITADGSDIYAISQSGFTVIPIGTLQQQPIAMPDSGAGLMAFDQCGVFASLNTATIPVRNVGGGRITVAAALATTTTTSPQVRTTSKPYGADLTATFAANAARSLGTATPDVVILQSPEAVNIPPNVRLYQNFRNPESRGTIFPVEIGASATGLTDMLQDPARPRLYIANPGLNRLEVFDTQLRQFLTPIAVGQLPRSMALGTDTNLLYVANSGGESISIVDLTKGAVTGSVQFPDIPFNAGFAVLTPTALASTQRGPQVIMSDGSLWKIEGNNILAPRTLNPNIFGATARTIPAPQSMAATSDGSFLLLLAGNGSAFLYSAAQDDFITGKTVINTPITGYFGAVAAGPAGAYYLAGDQLLNQALTSATGGGAGARPVAALFAVGAQTYVRYTMPPRPNATTAPTDPGLLELVDPTNARVLGSASTLEGPPTPAIAGQRANINARTMVVDAATTTAYVITTSGLTVLQISTAASAAPPILNGTAMVNTANFQGAVAPGGLVSILGRNLATSATAPTGTATALPTSLGGSCVTFNGSPLNLLATSDAQINAQLPTTLAAGRYPLVVHNLNTQTLSGTSNVTVAKYAPAIFVDADGPAIFHRNGTRLDKDHPGKRDEPLFMYATGLGVTTGGKVLTGLPAPSSPLAVTAAVQLFFGDPTRSDTPVIVDWSGLVPGMIGVYQINCRIPGTHFSGSGIPVTLRIGGVSSPVTGANVPLVWVQ